MEKSGKPRVAIIGGGISGLAAAKELRWLEPVLFEATDSIGGVWRHCSFRTTRLQTPRPDYEFSDYQWADRNDPTFPTHSEILEYLHGYATHFDLWRFIELETKVVEIRFVGHGETKTGFTDLWGDKGRPIADGPAWEVGVVTPRSNTVQVHTHFFFLFLWLGFARLTTESSYSSGASSSSWLCASGSTATSPTCRRFPVGRGRRPS